MIVKRTFGVAVSLPDDVLYRVMLVAQTTYGGNISMAIRKCLEKNLPPYIEPAVLAEARLHRELWHNAEANKRMQLAAMAKAAREEE